MDFDNIYPISPLKYTKLITGMFTGVIRFILCEKSTFGGKVKKSLQHISATKSVGLNEIEQGIWDAYFGPVRLGRFDEREAKSKSASYLSLKSVTHVP